MDKKTVRPVDERETTWLDEISFSTKIVVVVTVVAIGGSFVLWVVGLFV